MVAGGMPERPYEAPPEPTGNYMNTNTGLGKKYLTIADSEELRMGDNDGDFTVSFALRYGDNDGNWNNMLHKGNSDGERTPAMWRYPGQNGIHARITGPNNGNDGVDKSGNLDYGVWTYITYLKKGRTLSVWYDGVKDSEKALAGPITSNNGPLYFGGDPWYYSCVNADFDNLQIHMKALSDEEIQVTATGAILFNDELVLAYDFGSIIDGVVQDLSPNGNHGTVNGDLTFPVGGAPEGKTVLVLPEPGQYMSVDGTSDMLEIAHTDELALGQDNADFTV